MSELKSLRIEAKSMGLDIMAIMTKGSKKTEADRLRKAILSYLKQRAIGLGVDPNQTILELSEDSTEEDVIRKLKEVIDNEVVKLEKEVEENDTNDVEKEHSLLLKRAFKLGLDVGKIMLEGGKDPYDALRMEIERCANDESEEEATEMTPTETLKMAHELKLDVNKIMSDNVDNPFKALSDEVHKAKKVCGEKNSKSLIYWKKLNRAISKDKKFDPLVVTEIIDKMNVDEKATAVSRYFNQFFCLIRREQNPIYVETIFKTRGKNERIKQNVLRSAKDFMGSYPDAILHLPDSMGNMRAKNAVKMWMDSPYKRSYDYVTFQPYSRDPPKNVDNVFNLFSGMKHEYDPDLEVDMNLIEPILHHFKRVIFGNDAKIYNYGMNVLALQVQHPDHKSGICTVITGKQGTGKSMIVEAVGRQIFGEDYVFYCNSLSEVTGQFTSHFNNKLFSVLDEVGTFAGNYKEMDRLKSLLTSEWEKCESKGRDAFQVRSFNNYWMLTNHTYVIFYEDEQRRYFCVQADPIYKGNKEYFDNLMDYINPKKSRKGVDFVDNVWKHVFHYLMRIDLTGFEQEKIPETNYSKTLSTFRIQSECEFFANWVETHTIDEKVGKTELYEQYKCYMNDQRLFKRKKGLKEWLKAFREICGDELFNKIDCKSGGRRYYLRSKENMKMLKEKLINLNYEVGDWDEDVLNVDTETGLPKGECLLDSD